jgi:uncharacterized protein with HEPN domain
VTQQRIALYLSHVVDAIDQITAYVRDMDKTAFLGNRLVQDAVIRNLEIIGEACNNVRKVAPEFAAGHPEVPWGNAIGNRNALSHGYFRVDFELVWQSIRNDLPGLRQAISALLT